MRCARGQALCPFTLWSSGLLERPGTASRTAPRVEKGWSFLGTRAGRDPTGSAAPPALHSGLMTQGCGGLLSEERPVGRERSAEHEPNSVLVTHLQTKLPPERGAAANNFRAHVGRKQVCSGQGGEPSPARATPPGAGAERPASSRQHLYGTILVARSDWPTTVTLRPCAQRWRPAWAEVSFRSQAGAAVRSCGTRSTFLECGGERFLCDCFHEKNLCVTGTWQEPPSHNWEQAARWQRGDKI